jgi:hypothetical protein
VTSLADLASACRSFGALERRLFEVLGGWVPSVPEAEAKLLLRSHSFQHAWHAELWDGTAPRAGGARPQAGVGAAAAELVTVLESVPETASTADRLGVAYGDVLPRLVGAYRDTGLTAAPASDGPLVRVLSLVLADEEPALAAGRLLLDGLVGTSTGEAALSAADDRAGVRAARATGPTGKL